MEHLAACQPFLQLTDHRLKVASHCWELTGRGTGHQQSHRSQCIKRYFCTTRSQPSVVQPKAPPHSQHLRSEDARKRKGQPPGQSEASPNEMRLRKSGRRETLLHQQDVCFHSSFSSLMPSSDERVTLQTDFSFKPSLVPAISLPSQITIPTAGGTTTGCYGNGCKTRQASKSGQLVRKS